jgi:di/tricarboxylate transporter
MKSEKTCFTQFNSLSSLFPDKFLSGFFTLFATGKNAAGNRLGDVPHNGMNAVGIRQW